MNVVLIPGWHENVDDMRLFVDGRNGKPGLAARGYDCFVVPEGGGGLNERIARFATVLDDIKSREPEAFPIATFGYSAGGLINRGFLRAHPERAGEIAAALQLAAPNAGVVFEDVALTLRAFRFSQKAIEDLQCDSSFMAWLNGTTGHFVPVSGKGGRRWEFDAAPVPGPPGVPLLNIAGSRPRDPGGDGVVSVDSATLSGAFPSQLVEAQSATHLNLSGVWNPFTLLFRGWRADDTLWPLVVERADRFFQDAQRSRTSR